MPAPRLHWGEYILVCVLPCSSSGKQNPEQQSSKTESLLSQVEVSKGYASLAMSAVSSLCPGALRGVAPGLLFIPSSLWPPGVSAQGTAAWLPIELTISKSIICVVLASQSIRVTVQAAQLCDQC